MVKSLIPSTVALSATQTTIEVQVYLHVAGKVVNPRYSVLPTC